MRRPAEERALRDLRLAVDAIADDPTLRPGEAARRWQQVVRCAEQARDEAVARSAPPDLAPTVAGGQAVGRGVAAALWAAQREVLARGWLDGPRRAALQAAAAQVVDWLVEEFPADTSGRARRPHT